LNGEKDLSNPKVHVRYTYRTDRNMCTTYWDSSAEAKSVSMWTARTWVNAGSEPASSLFARSRRSMLSGTVWSTSVGSRY
jgi:hypothetical protein